MNTIERQPEFMMFMNSSCIDPSVIPPSSFLLLANSDGSLFDTSQRRPLLRRTFISSRSGDFERSSKKLEPCSLTNQRELSY